MAHFLLSFFPQLAQFYFSRYTDKQSYDVWEQLRCRDLSDDYLPLAARCFARKVIANIMPTMYSESGLIFISHRRLDGEEITAQLCDTLSVQFEACETFRDVTSVKLVKKHKVK